MASYNILEYSEISRESMALMDLIEVLKRLFSEESNLLQQTLSLATYVTLSLNETTFVMNVITISELVFLLSHLSKNFHSS